MATLVTCLVFLVKRRDHDARGASGCPGGLVRARVTFFRRSTQRIQYAVLFRETLREIRPMQRFELWPANDLCVAIIRWFVHVGVN